MTPTEALIAALRGDDPIAMGPNVPPMTSAGAVTREPLTGVPPRGKMTADLLRRMGNELMSEPAIRPISMTPVAQELEGRPSIEALYDKLDLENRKPLDYSGLTAINKARGEAGGRDWLGGLALSALGGKTLAPAGAQLFQQALKDREPIRPNAADLGWTNPETGEVVTNPMLQRQQDEKVLTGRIDALVKEKEAEARIAAAKGQNELANQLREMALRLTAQRNAITIVQTNNKADADIARAGRGTGTKPLSRAEVNDLTHMAQGYENMDMLVKTFKPEFAGGIMGTPGAEMSNAVMSNFPVLAGHMMTAKGRAAAKAKADWWRNQQKLDAMVERHENFGSALTAPEIAAWNSATIRPGMQEEEIKKNFTTRMEIVRQASQRLHDTQIANGKHPDAVKAGLKGVPLNNDAFTEVPNPGGDEHAAGAAAEIERRKRAKEKK